MNLRSSIVFLLSFVGSMSYGSEYFMEFLMDYTYFVHLEDNGDVMLSVSFSHGDPENEDFCPVV